MLSHIYFKQGDSPACGSKNWNHEVVLAENNLCKDCKKLLHENHEEVSFFAIENMSSSCSREIEDCKIDYHVEYCRIGFQNGKPIWLYSDYEKASRNYNKFLDEKKDVYDKTYTSFGVKPDRHNDPYGYYDWKIAAEEAANAASNNQEIFFSHMSPIDMCEMRNELIENKLISEKMRSILYKNASHLQKMTMEEFRKFFQENN